MGLCSSSSCGLVMGALRLPKTKQQEFDEYLDSVKVESVTPPTSIGSGSSSSSISNAARDSRASSSLSDVGRTANGTFASITNGIIGGTVVGAILNPIIDVIKRSYEERSRQLETGVNKPQNEPNAAPDPATRPEPVIPEDSKGTSGLVPSSASDKTSLIDVLKSSSDNVGAVAEVILYSNMQIVASLELLNKSVEKLTDVVVLNGEVQQAYSDLNLEVEAMRHDVEVAYKEATLANHYDLMQTYGDLLASGQNVDAVRDNLNSRMNAIDRVNEGLRVQIEDSNRASSAYSESLLSKLNNVGISINNEVTTKINRDENEVALTDKKLEKVNYELTPKSVTDIHGNDTITASPLELATMKNIGVATSTALENSTTADELGLDDFNDSLDLGLSDLLKIFTFNGISDNLTALANISENGYASHTPNVQLK